MYLTYLNVLTYLLSVLWVTLGQESSLKGIPEMLKQDVYKQVTMCIEQTLQKNQKET